MLRFFRRIRQKLFQEGKVSRYLGYAIGEIVLIVVGILIAVEANEWKENIREDALEQQYVKRLISDFQQEIVQVEAAIRIAEMHLDLVDLLIETADNAEVALVPCTIYKFG